MDTVSPHLSRKAHNYIWPYFDKLRVSLTFPGETILGLRENLTSATDCLTGVDSSVAVSSGGELFLRFISLTSLEHQVRGLLHCSHPCTTRKHELPTFRFSICFWCTQCKHFLHWSYCRSLFAQHSSLRERKKKHC